MLSILWIRQISKWVQCSQADKVSEHHWEDAMPRKTAAAQSLERAAVGESTTLLVRGTPRVIFVSNYRPDSMTGFKYSRG